MTHPFTFPAANPHPNAPAKPAPAAPSPPPPPPPAAAAAAPGASDGFFAGVGGQGAGAQRLPDVTCGDYPQLRVEALKRAIRWDGEKMVIAEFTVMAPATKTDPLADPLLPGAKFSQIFFIRHAPAWSSMANLLACVFGVSARTITPESVAQLLPQITEKGAPAAPCVLNGQGCEVGGMFFSRAGSEFLSVNWRAVPGRTYPDVVQNAAVSGG